MRKYAEELEARGWTDGRSAFDEVLVETLHGMFPGWTDEGLLFNPWDAMAYCAAVARKTGLRGRKKELANLVLRMLVNVRKSGACDAAS